MAHTFAVNKTIISPSHIDEGARQPESSRCVNDLAHTCERALGIASRLRDKLALVLPSEPTEAAKTAPALVSNYRTPLFQELNSRRSGIEDALDEIERLIQAVELS